MVITELRSLIANLKAIFAAGGATRQARTIASIEGLIPNNDRRTICAFVTDARGALSRSTSSEPMKVRERVVSGYVFRLKEAGLNRDKFNMVMSNLIADKAVRKIELAAIASEYQGTPLALASRTAAIDAIEKRFVELARFERKQKIAARIMPC